MSDLWQQISDSKRWPKFIRRVNVSIRRIRRREVLTFLLFVAIAGFFWTVQTSREENVQDFVVQLNVTDLPQNIVFTTHVPQQLRVSMSDTNARLFNYRLKDRMSHLDVKFERYADAVGNFRLSGAELQSLLSAELESTTRIVSVSPALIDALFALTEGRKFPVRLAAQYAPGDNYRMRDIRIVPDSVIINAPSSVLDTLQCVYATDVNRLYLCDTLVEMLDLDLPIGVKSTPAQVKVTIPVVKYVEKVFEQVVVNTTDVPQGHRLITFPYSVRLSCLVDFSRYTDTTADLFDVTVSYDSIRHDDPDQHFLPITVRYRGNDDAVSAITLSQDRAEFVLE